MTKKTLDQLCEWMRQSQRWEATKRDRAKGRAWDKYWKRKRQRKEALKLARIAVADRMFASGRGWYDPRKDYWTLSAECPEWADEMRRIEARRYKRKRRS